MKRALLIVLCACSGGSNGPDAPIDDNLLRPDSSDDIDLDGILNVDDNCPTVVNQNQGNEDGDKFGDACDACPVVADDAPPDSDGDGVADACDPLPTMPGDFIRYFEGFHKDVPAGWEEIGTWTHVTGAVRTTSANAGLAIVATDRTRETVSASLTFDAVQSTSRAGVVDAKMAGGLGVACVISADPAVEVYATNDAGNAMQTSYEQTVGTQYVVKLRRNMNEYTCTATAGASASATKTLGITQTPYLSGITAEASTVRFHWFMVVESL
jgi:hypothetical protein